MPSLALLPKARALSSIALGVDSAATLASPAHAVQLQQDFAGAYAPSSWTFTSDPSLGDGSVDIEAAHAAITVIGSNNGESTVFFDNVNTDYTIAAAHDGQVSFDWSYSSGHLEKSTSQCNIP